MANKRICSLLIAIAMTLPGIRATAVPFPKPPWESGSFARLPLRGSGDLVDYVGLLTHDSSYSALTPARESQVGAMFDAIQAAITAMISGSATCPDCNSCPDWCAAVKAANNAGYLLGRYYDTVSSRWFIVGSDGAGGGQAYFVINPQPRRDLIVEAPHVYAPAKKSLESGTAREGALLLRQLLGRALLINGADRCQGSNSPCAGTLTSNEVCDGHPAGQPYLKSDMAHNMDSAFHVLHKKFDASTSSRFVQLHGNNKDPSTVLSVSDGRTWNLGSSGLATAFVQKLPGGALPPGSVNDCTSQLDFLCGYDNVQGRYTNSGTLSCTGPKLSVGGTRFLHLEQRSSLIGSPQPVSDALQGLFPCPGCSLPTQPFVSGPDCPGIIQARPCPELATAQGPDLRPVGRIALPVSGSPDNLPATGSAVQRRYLPGRPGPSP